MIKAYDYYGHIDLGAEHDDEDFPYQSCPICVSATSPSDSELIYEGLCIRCAGIITTVYSHPQHPICQSACIPVVDDSAQVLGLIKMKLYNMIESSTNTNNSDYLEIIKDLMGRTPAEFTILSLINDFLITSLTTGRVSLHSMTFMINTAHTYDYIDLEIAQSLNRRAVNLDFGRGV